MFALSCYRRILKVVHPISIRAMCTSNLKQNFRFEENNFIQYFKGKHHIKDNILSSINSRKLSPLLSIDCVGDELYIGTRVSQFLTIHRKSNENVASKIDMVLNMRVVHEKAKGNTLVSVKPNADGNLVAFCFESDGNERKMLAVRHIESGNWLVIRFPREIEAEFPFGVSTVEWFDIGASSHSFPAIPEHLSYPVDVKIGAVLIVSLTDEYMRASAIAYVGVPMFWNENEARKLCPPGRIDRRKSLHEQKIVSRRPFLLSDGVDCDALWFGIVRRESDETMYLDVNKTKDSSFITLTTSSKTSSSVELISRKLSDDSIKNLFDRNQLSLIFLKEREARSRYFADYGDDILITLKSTDQLSVDFKLCFSRLSDKSNFFESSSWNNLNGSFAIDDIDYLHKAVIVYCRDIRGVLGQGAGQECVLVASRNHNCKHIADHLAPFQCVKGIPVGASIAPGSNSSYYSSSFLLSYSTPVSDEVFAEFGCESGDLLGVLLNTSDMETKLSDQSSILRVAVGMSKNIIDHKNKLRKRPVSTPMTSETSDLDSKFDEKIVNDKIVFRLSCLSSDGACQIPITCAMNRNSYNAWKSGKKLDLRAMVHVYGAYGVCLDTDYKEHYTPMIDQGWIIVFCHVRGGGEMGRQWYLDGIGFNKKRSVLDLIDCCEYLCTQNLTTLNNRKIAVTGHSAGAVVVGQSINLRPQLFGAAIMNSPFVDILSAMNDKTNCLTRVEYEEWGDPEKPDELANIVSISPRQNIKSQQYPPVMLTVGLADPRINSSHVLAYAAELRRADSTNIVVVNVDSEDGHFGPMHVKGQIEHIAYQCTFLNSCIPK